ncbi:MAG: EF-P lysine aminoacylase EpmA [Steroidobacteraceae bacterium]
MLDWRPTATRERLACRAAMLAAARRFFDERGLLEVDTPMLVNAAVTDVHLEVVEATLAGKPDPLFVHTSPEYAMKRLLAAGSGEIYQICHVARAEERSPLHNPEFTLIEWYRLVALPALIDEVAALLNALMTAGGSRPRTLVVRRYAEAFKDYFDLDPLTADAPQLRSLAGAQGLDAASARGASRDDCLDFLVGTRLGPSLGHGQWLALTHYPASQAALAELDAEDPRVALRFEIYADGIELANGFRELAAGGDQRRRFEGDNRERQRRGRPTRTLDERLLAALEAGLPPCSGVALGFDRCVMLASGASRIDDVLAFPTERA